MVKIWVKFLQKIDKKIAENIYIIIQKLLDKEFENLDIKKMKWEKFLYRCRYGNIRIIYFYDEEDLIIKKIGFRWDIYKN